MDALVNKKIIVEILSRGPMKCLVIAKLNDAQFSILVAFTDQK
jgi:hypothetical protein